MKASKKKLPLVSLVLLFVFDVFPSTAAFSADISLEHSAVIAIDSTTTQSAMRFRCRRFVEQGVAVGTHSAQASREKL
jgi:hypothetical protein